MLNVIFTVLFTVEMILKLMAFKAKVSPISTYHTYHEGQLFDSAAVNLLKMFNFLHNTFLRNFDGEKPVDLKT